MKKIFIVFILVLIGIGAYDVLLPIFTGKNQQTQPQLSTITFGTQTYKIEIADTDDARSKGLSGRSTLARDEGMLFIFQTKDTYSFWMKDMQFPLDFVWLDGDTVVDITENVPVPLTATYAPAFRPKQAVNQVLEINAGEIKRVGIKVGDKVGFSLFDDKNQP